MRKISLFIFIIPLLFLHACKDDPNVKYFTRDAVIIDAGGIQTADGCGWVVSIDDVSYHPVNLEQRYQQHNLAVRITYRLDDTPFVCGIASMKMQSIYIKDIEILSKKCNQYGTVYDYTGLDGCSFVIHTDSGERLEVVEIVPNFVLKDQQRVKFSYTDLQRASICMVGKTVRIDCIEDAGCMPISRDLTYGVHQDPVSIQKMYVEDDCLKIKLSYGGGCNVHEFRMQDYNGRCGTPPVDPTKNLRLYHNANGDMCEAWITELLSYDLISIQDPNKNSVNLVITVDTQDGPKNYNLTYTY